MALGRTRFRQRLGGDSWGDYRSGRIPTGSGGEGQVTTLTALAANYSYAGQVIQNQVPIWLQVPEVVFEATATAQVFPTSGTYQSNRYVVDFDGDPLTITKNTVFVQGVTWDGGKFLFDGTGSDVVSTGHILTANDGHGGLKQTNSFTIRITGEPSWIETTADIVFTIGTQGSFDLQPYLLSFNQDIHSVQVHSSSPTLPSGVTVDSVDTTVGYDGTGTLEEDVNAVLEIVDDAVEDPGNFSALKTLTINIGAFTSSPPAQPVVGSWATQTSITAQAGSTYNLANHWNGGVGRTNRFEVADGRDFVFPSGITMNADGLISVAAGTANQSFQMKFRAANDGESNDDIRELNQFDDRVLTESNEHVGEFTADEFYRYHMNWTGGDHVTAGPPGGGGFVGPNGDTITPYHTFVTSTSSGSFNVPTHANLVALVNRFAEHGRGATMVLTGPASGMGAWRIRSRENSGTGQPAKLNITYVGGGTDELFVVADAALSTTSTSGSPVGEGTVMDLSSTSRIWLRFPKPSGSVTAASLTMFVSSLAGSGGGKTVSMWLGKPPIEDSDETVGYLKDEGGLYYHRRNPGLEPGFFDFGGEGEGGANHLDTTYVDTTLGHVVTRAALAQGSGGRSFSASVPLWHPSDTGAHAFAEANDVEFEYWFYYEDTYDAPLANPSAGVPFGGKHFGFSGPTTPTEATPNSQWRYTTNGAGVGGLITSPVNASNPQGRSPRGRFGTPAAGNGGDPADGKRGWSMRGRQVPAFSWNDAMGSHPLRDYVSQNQYVYLPSYRFSPTGTIRLQHEWYWRSERYQLKAQANDPFRAAEASSPSSSTSYPIVNVTNGSPPVVTWEQQSSSQPAHLMTNDNIVSFQNMVGLIGLAGDYRIANAQHAGSGEFGELKTFEITNLDGSAVDTTSMGTFASGGFRTANDTRGREIWIANHPTSTQSYRLPGESLAFDGSLSGTGNDILWQQYGRSIVKRLRWKVVRARINVNTPNPALPAGDIDFRDSVQDPNLFGNWDGRLRVWMDGKKTTDITGLCMRYTGPYFLTGVNTELGCARIWLNLYAGGGGSAIPIAPSFFRFANLSVRVNEWGGPLTPVL